MKSILVGNGVNIQFGGKAYSNTFILKRIKYRAYLDSYSKLFGNALNQRQIIYILTRFPLIAEEIIAGNYDDYAIDEDTYVALCDFKFRYKNGINYPYGLMMEDWFFVLHMQNLKYKDTTENRIAFKQGFEELFLDSIYNNGKVQTIFKNANGKVKKYMSSFDNIFTLNYDRNIENLTGNNVFHLHGDFTVLANSECLSTAEGFVRESKRMRAVIDNFGHCFCNALLDYSGMKKLKTANAFHALIEKSDFLLFQYTNDEDFRMRMDSERPDFGEQIRAKIQHPELTLGTEYHFDKFCSIDGELSIVGMSPNNDSHIFECIAKSRVTKVYFYYFLEEEKKYIDEHFDQSIFESRSVKELWKSLDCWNDRRYYEYNIKEDVLDYFVDKYNALTFDDTSKEEILGEVSYTSPYEINRLYELIAAEIFRRNPSHAPVTEEEFRLEAASISYIALQEGYSPSSLPLMFILSRQLRPKTP